MTESSADHVQITLPRDAALVLFEMLATKEPSIGESAEQVALSKLEGALERTLVEPLQPNYKSLLAAARERLTK